MDQAIKMLELADRQLEQISVSHGDVFSMCNARRLLKTAYDLLRKGVTNNEPTVLDSVGDPGDRS